MADREALRDFQRRLAHRLQAAPAEGIQAAWLAVQAAGAHFLIPLAQAGEIFPEAAVHPVPYTQPWFLGVASLRGALHGVVDLAQLLAHCDCPVPPASPASRTKGPAGQAGQAGQAQWVSFSPVLDVQCVLRVDRLAGLRGAGAFTTTARDPVAGAPDWLGVVHEDTSAAHWQTLDLARLSQQPRFLRIAS